jgi:hypothetical protein
MVCAEMCTKLWKYGGRVEDSRKKSTTFPASLQKAQRKLHFVAALELREGIRGSFFETSEAAAENELDFVGRAVALFGDEDVGHVALFGRGVEIEEIGAIDEHDDVCVLLDGARFAQVGKLRATFVALGRAGELAEDENGNLQFLGEAFEAARNAGNFFLTGIETTASGDELQIIDNEKREALVTLEAARFCANFEDAGGAGIVDPKRRGGDCAESVGHAAPIFAAEMTGAEFVCVDLSNGSDETLQQRFLGHFEAEDGDGKAGANGDIFGQIERESGFSLRWARGENDQFGRLQAGEELVEFAVAGGDAGDAFAFAENFLEAFEIVTDDIFDRDETGFDAIFGEGKDLGFGAVEDGIGPVFAIESVLLNFVRGVNEITEHRLFLDDAGVMLDVGNARDAIHQRGKIGRAAGGFEFTATMEFFAESDEINGMLGFAEGDHLVENVAMLRKEKIVGLEGLDGGVEGIVIEQDGAENGTLRVKIAR